MRNFLNTAQEKQARGVKTGANYYYHGPLARVETGDLQVQGQDYVYTLQGWIKGVNSNTLDSLRDPGQDGDTSALNPNRYFPKDVYGYSLGYFMDDYSPIDASKTGTGSFYADITGSDVEDNRFDLFNGNIGSMVTTITNPTTRETLPLGNAYKYDQLNRLIEARSFNNLNSSTNTFGTGGSEMYFNAFSYDANGNILTQWRKDHTNAEIDSLHYKYARNADDKIIQNRLYHVRDRTDYNGNDIDDMGAFDGNLSTINTNNNYSYSAIGELEKDEQEEIAQIIYRADSKVKEVIRTGGSSKKNLKFDYDITGNRIAKHVYTSSGDWQWSEYYVRDVQGNIMSTYKHSIGDETMSYQLTEQHIYGDDLLGIRRDTLEMIGAIVDTTNYIRTLRKKNYYLKNQLNNILSVITDMKVPQDFDSDDTVDVFYADIVSATDYSSFGVELESRSFSSSNSIIGFNSMRKDDEIAGEGNSYTTLYRQLDTRLGRWLTIDPEAVRYPELSPYQTMENNPVFVIDPDGDGPIVTRKVVQRLSNVQPAQVVYNNPNIRNPTTIKGTYRAGATLTFDAFNNPDQLEIHRKNEDRELGEHKWRGDQGSGGLVPNVQVFNVRGGRYKTQVTLGAALGGGSTASLQITENAYQKVKTVTKYRIFGIPIVSKVEVQYIDPSNAANNGDLVIKKRVLGIRVGKATVAHDIHIEQGNTAGTPNRTARTSGLENGFFGFKIRRLKHKG